MTGVEIRAAEGNVGSEDDVATASFVDGRLYDATSAPERCEEALPSAKGDGTPPLYRREGLWEVAVLPPHSTRRSATPLRCCLCL